MLDKIIRKYRRYVALVNPRIEKYANAERELRQTLILAPISLAPAVLHYVGVLGLTRVNHLIKCFNLRSLNV